MIANIALRGKNLPYQTQLVLLVRMENFKMSLVHPYKSSNLKIYNGLKDLLPPLVGRKEQSMAISTAKISSFQPKCLLVMQVSFAFNSVFSRLIRGMVGWTVRKEKFLLTTKKFGQKEEVILRIVRVGLMQALTPVLQITADGTITASKNVSLMLILTLTSVLRVSS